MLNFRRSIFLSLCLLVAGSAMASNFRAGDVVYVPSAGRVASGSVTFITDVYITNLTTNTVDVDVAFGLSGGVDNTAITSQTKRITPSLAPGERRLISDITGSIFPEKNGNVGFLIFFACKSGGNCSNCDTNPADCSLISVESRIFSQGANPGTTGQLFPGIPWYSFISMNDAASGLDKVFITGLRNEGARGVNGYRSNVGILNASQDYSTVITVEIHNGNGSLVASQDFPLPPLGHRQVNVTSIAPSFTTNNTTGYAVVFQKSATFVSGCQACDPGFLTYGSVLDNITDDPTTQESQYTQQLDIRCVYGAKANHRRVRKP